MISKQHHSRRVTAPRPSSLLLMAGLTLTLWGGSSRPALAQRLRGGNQAIAVNPGVTLSPNALAQISALDAEKTARTPTQRKIDSQLLYKLKMARHQMIAPGVATLQTSVVTDNAGMTLVDIDARVTGPTLKQIIQVGGTIINNFAAQNAIRANVPLMQIETIAALADVKFIRPAALGKTQGRKATLSREWKARHTPALSFFDPTFGSSFPGSFGASLFAPFLPREAQLKAGLPSLLTRARQARSLPETRSFALRPSYMVGAGLFDPPVFSPLGAPPGKGTGPGHTTNAGKIDSEGDVTHRANLARSMYGVDGTGIKIGVLSNGVNSLAISQSTGDLGPVTVLPGQAGDGDEGTAMLEIVHDLAPGAALYFATAHNGQPQFAANIRALRAAGCDIIVDDEFYFTESPFQDNIISLAVDDVVAQGALYFSSAGNDGNRDAGTATVWQGDFADGASAGIPSDPGARYHSFGGQLYDVANLGFGTTQIYVDLFWSDPLGASANDYDLYVFDNTGQNLVSSSTNSQTGSQDPYELTVVSDGQLLVIVKHSGAAPRFLYLGLEADDDPYLSLGTTGRTRGHAATVGGFGVAATPARGPYPNPFNTFDVVETFSSDGPRIKFFNPDGSAITPGNFSSTGGVVLKKPDITAADGVSTTVSGFESFSGTSAAAPHAAAIAGLLKSYNPALTLAQVQTALESTATDIMAPGFDRDSGYGILDAVNALGSVQPGALVSVSAGTSSVNGGRVIQGSVTLYNAAPSGGAVVSLAVSPTGAVTVPMSVTVPAGQKTAAFPITVATVTNDDSVTITAVYSGVTRVTALNVQAQYLISGMTTTLDGAALSGVTLTAFGLGTATLPALSTSPNIPIPDGSGITSPVGGGAVSASVNVTTTGQVQSLKAGVVISHVFPIQLQVILIAPDGTQVVLQNPDGTFNGFNINTSYPDLTTPVGDLSTLVGKSITGTWRLTAQDFYAIYEGTLNSFTLTLTANNTPIVLTATSDSSGAFSFANQRPLTFTLTPTKPGFSFLPASRSVTIGPDQTAQNFALSQASMRTSATAVFVNNEYQVTVTLANGADASAANTQITRAILGSASAPTAPALPSSLGSIASGSAGTVVLHFPLSAGAHGSRVLLRVSGSSTQGAFGGSVQLTLP